MTDALVLRVPLEAVLTQAGGDAGQVVVLARVVLRTERPARLLAPGLARHALVHFVLLALDGARCTRTDRSSTVRGLASHRNGMS